MKVAIIVAVALLALAHGSFAQDATDIEKISQYIDSMKTQIMSSVSAQNLQSQLEPMTTQLQEQLKTMATNLEEQIKPLAASVQAQMQPMMESFQEQIKAFIKKMGETGSGN